MRAALVLLLCAVTAAPSVAEESRKDTRPPIAPDIRDDETRLKIQHAGWKGGPWLGDRAYPGIQPDAR